MKKQSKFLEAIYLFSSLFMVFLLLVVLWFSFRYWSSNFPYVLSLEAQMFYIAVGIAIVTSVAQWIEGRIKIIIETMPVVTEPFIKLFKGGVNNGGKERGRKDRGRSDSFNNG